jgi:hypothetical protein
VKRALLVLFVTGCMPHMSAGYDTTTKLSGPLSNMVSQPAAAARQDVATVAPVVEQKSYSFSVGGGNRRFGIDTSLHLHDVNGQSFDLPTATGVAPESPRYLLTTLSLDFRLGLLLLPHLDTSAHFGPATGVVIDRTDGTHAYADGFRVGGTASVWWGHLATFVDVYQTTMVFTSGPAEGTSRMTGFTVGIALR